MKFFFISEDGDGLGLALRVANEGNEVAMWIRHDQSKDIGKGLIKRIHDDFTFTPDKETIYIFDCTGSGHLADLLRSTNHYVLGGSILADRLEMDRAYAREVMKACGLTLPKSKKFSDVEVALEFITEHEDMLVVKPIGESSGVVPSFVAKDIDELAHRLEEFRGKPVEFELQQFVKGTDISTEVWFDGQDRICPCNHTLEAKAFANGDLGPATGCAGNVVWASEDELVENTVHKLDKFLSDNDYRGPIDVNVIVAEDDVYALEFTPRFGYDAMPALLYGLLEVECGEFLSDFARGQATSMPLAEGFAAGLRVSIPPYPTLHGDVKGGVAIKTHDQFYPMDLMLVGKELQSAGSHGILGVVIGHGQTIESAVAEATKVAEKIQVPDKHYRTDISEVLMRKHRKVGQTVGIH